MPRHVLTLSDLSGPELGALLDLAADMKAGRWRQRPLSGRTVALLFSKSSTRTRVSFEVGIGQLGGHSLFLSPRDVQVGRGETIRDTARALSRYLDALVIRWHDHAGLEEFARFATVPVVNGLTDYTHPCQVLADLLTIQEEFGTVPGRTVAWIGDGNNMANAWIEAASRLDFTLRLACPDGYHPHAGLLAAAGSNVTLTADPREAVAGADVVTTDVWASMGQEDEAAARAAAFAGYTVDDALMHLAADSAIFLHCLPAHRGEEVSDAVLEGPRSRVWDEAENRLHVQKALLATLMG
ncbi:MAG TPA: ornithine carbamoyltransferase [Gemmatimonadales bacterium]|nr:ornithine carbamoyltransferase [Gemmatimonadales bacterium]